MEYQLTLLCYVLWSLELIRVNFYDLWITSNVEHVLIFLILQVPLSGIYFTVHNCETTFANMTDERVVLFQLPPSPLSSLLQPCR